MKNTQNKTVELYNRNNPFYWDVEKFVTEQGYKNACEYCYDYEYGITLDNEKDVNDYIENYAIDLYGLWYNGKI